MNRLTQLLNRTTGSASEPAQAGFTAIEIMVVLGLTAILAVIGISQLPSLSQPFDRMMARSHFIQDIKRAQAEAIKWGCRGVFSIADGGGNYQFGCDFLPTDGSNPPAPDQVFFARNLPAAISISVSSPLIFSSRGQAVDIFGDINNVTISLIESSDGSPQEYARGTLMGTGAFSFSQEL